MHKHTQTVIDRALAQDRKIVDNDVYASNTLREVALDYVQTYQGHSAFVQDIAVKLSIYGSLTHAQMRGALNVMIREARQTTTPADDKPFMDLRSKNDKERETAGEPPIKAANTVDDGIAHVAPNGTYTIVLDVDNYVTIKLTSAPDHFNAAPGTQIASYLIGSDNERDFLGFAFVAGDKIRIWSKFAQFPGKLPQQHSALEILLQTNPMTHAREYVMRSNRCFVCNRTLTTPTSIQLGIGPICRATLQAQGFAFDLMGDQDAAIEENNARDQLALENVAVDVSDYEARGDGSDQDIADMKAYARDYGDYSGLEQAYAARNARQAQIDRVNKAFYEQPSIDLAHAAAMRVSAEQAQADIDELFAD